MAVMKDKKIKKRRILLINPPYERLKGLSVESIPLGLLYIATALDRLGHKAIVYDADTDFEGGVTAYTNTNRARSQYIYRRALEDRTHRAWLDLRALLEEYRPDVVGVTVMTPTYSSSIKVFEMARSILPDSILIAGGPHVTITGAKIMEKNSFIDYAFTGEAEETVPLFLRSLWEEGPRIDRIKGIIYRENGGVRDTGRAPRIEDLNTLPYPDRSLLYRSEAYSRGRLSLMVASRGCPFNCAFCASVPLWERKVRMRSPQNILGEIEYLVERFGVRSFGFWDDTFTSSKSAIMEFSALLRDKYGSSLKWDCLTNVNCIDRELLGALKKVGCNRIRIGVESGSDHILKRIRKGITTESVMKAARLIKRQGLWLHAYFMVGIPYETEADIRQTMDFIRRLRPDSLNLCTFTPYPGTELYEYVLQNKLMPGDYDYSMYDSMGHHSTDSFFMTRIDRRRYSLLLDEVLDLATDVTGRLTFRKILLKSKMATPDKVARTMKRRFKRLMSHKRRLRKAR